jgi:hypothetical protein
VAFRSCDSGSSSRRIVRAGTQRAVRNMLGERYRARVLLVANRVCDPEEGSGRCAVAVPDSRLSALRIARGWPPGARSVTRSGGSRRFSEDGR